MNTSDVFDDWLKSQKISSAVWRKAADFLESEANRLRHFADRTDQNAESEKRVRKQLKVFDDALKLGLEMLDRGVDLDLAADMAAMRFNVSPEGVKRSIQAGKRPLGCETFEPCQISQVPDCSIVLELEKASKG